MKVVNMAGTPTRFPRKPVIRKIDRVDRLPLRHGRAGQASERGVHVVVHHQLTGHSRSDLSRPRDDAGHAVAALPCSRFLTAQRATHTPEFLEHGPRAIVGCKYDDRFLRELFCLKRFYDLPH